ncbi:MAG: hypothetical protein Q8Q95_00195 [bacterium]|nr:hypothetical protein [bacterium]
MKNVIIIIIIAVVAGGIGYTIRGSNGGMQDKKLQDSISMMKEQSGSIQKMAEMMKTSGTVMQEMGMKYKDETAIEKGKDLQAVGEKYVKENEKATESSASMKDIMDK